ncbi:MAG: hypothetical protein QOG54_199 [Actinomycetota bacterium]|nr:hypothetical protein [Actinomycetota bacterium]
MLRRMVTVAGVATLAVLAVVFVRADVFEGDLFEGQRQQVGGSPTASPEPPAELGDAAIGERYRTLRKTLTSVPGWAIDADNVDDAALLRRCGGDYLDGAGGAGHNLGLSVNPGDPPPVAVGTELEGFNSPAQASDAVDRLIGNLTSCKAESWGSHPIGQTGAELAFSDAGVVWIHQRGTSVATLEVATTDGPPPLAVQVEVADLIYSWFCTVCDD